MSNTDKQTILDSLQDVTASLENTLLHDTTMPAADRRARWKVVERAKAILSENGIQV